MSRLDQQLAFLLEIDELKSVLRRTILLNKSRIENSAEHSWHIALLAIILAEYAPAPIELPRVLKMLLIHDLVEIDAGDTFCYDQQANLDKARREELAADRIFNLLPPDQAAELRNLWNEFEANQTTEARFANALDRLQPLLHNYHTQGQQWQQHNVTYPQVLARNQLIADGAPALWPPIKKLLEDAVAKNYLRQ